MSLLLTTCKIADIYPIMTKKQCDKYIRYSSELFVAGALFAFRRRLSSFLALRRSFAVLTALRSRFLRSHVPVCFSSARNCRICCSFFFLSMILFLVFSQDIEPLNNCKHNHCTQNGTSTIADQWKGNSG